MSLYCVSACKKLTCEGFNQHRVVKHSSLFVCWVFKELLWVGVGFTVCPLYPWKWTQGRCYVSLLRQESQHSLQKQQDGCFEEPYLASEHSWENKQVYSNWPARNTAGITFPNTVTSSQRLGEKYMRLFFILFFWQKI